VNFLFLLIFPEPLTEYGAPEKIRTPNPLIRSQVLYPVELRARMPINGYEVFST
jgi:hypothetical protein